MALPKIQIPNERIFTSDPVEQIYAKGTLDPHMSGLSYMLLNAAQDVRQRDQGSYLEGVSSANALAAKLAQQEEANKAQQFLIGEGGKLAQHGFYPKDIPSLGALFRDPNSASANESPGLFNALRQAQINADNAKAAGVGGDNVTVEDIITPGGPGLTTIRVKGKDAGSAQDTALKLAIANQQRRGLTVNPNAPLSIPSVADARNAATTAATSKYKNIQN